MANADAELKKLLKNLKKLPAKLNKSVVNLAVKAAAKPILDNAKRNVLSELPDHSHSEYDEHNMGDLEDAIIVRKLSKGKQARENGDNKDVTTYRIGIKLDGSAWFAHFIEFGSKLHTAQPFMAPAFENSAGLAIAAMKNYMKKRFEKAVKKGLV